MRDDLTFDQILEMLKGKYAGSVGEGVMDNVGAKGLDTPAERDVLAKEFGSEKTDRGLIDAVINYKNTGGSRDYDFDVDGNTEGYTFTGDAPLSGEAIQNMRNIQGITPDGGMNPNLNNLGMGGGFDRGFETPAAREGAIAETEFLKNSFAGTGEVMGGGVDRASFNANFASLTPEQKARVTEMMAGMTPAQKKAFALGMTGKEGQSKLNGYEVSNQNRLAY